MSLTKVTYSMISGAATNVVDKGADNTGVASSVAAFNAAMLGGGAVYVPPGTYKLDSKVSVTVDGTTLFLAPNVTLVLSGVPATQVPFGNQIDVVANDFALIGSGPSSLLQVSGGSQANAIGILHHSGFMVRDVMIDGDKASGTAIADDTFMTGISIIVTAAGGATTDVQATIDNCIVQNFLQYGIQAYGELANGVKITNCNIRDIGKAGDAFSVGGGIAVTRGVSDFIANNNVIKNCKLDGMFISSAGVSGSGYAIANNICHQNGGSGIAFFEASPYASVSGVGLFNSSIANNVCSGNTRSGIRLSVDTLGYLKYFSITGNSCEGNTYGGIEALCTNTSPDIISNLTLSGNNVYDNGTSQVGIGQYVQLAEGVPRSFTPAIAGATSAGVGTYTAALGTYTKVGSLVTFQLVLDWTAHTGTGNMLITGLPYASSTSEPASTPWCWCNGITATGQVVLSVSPNATQGTLGVVNNGAYGVLAMDTVGTIRVSGSYFTD